MARSKRETATIKDIAREAQVSSATVSRVLNNPEYHVSPEIQSAVLDAASRLGYARETCLHHSQIRNDIGVIVPNLTNPMYGQVLTGIETIARDYNYGVFICNTLRDPAREYDYLCALHRKRIRSVILSTVAAQADGINEFVSRGMNLVLLDQQIPGVDCANVNFDMHAGVGLAVQHLVDYGHRRIGLAIMPITRSSRRQVSSGYLDALAKAGIEPDSALIFTPASEREEHSFGGDFAIGEEIGEKVAASLQSLTALVVANTVMACGILNAFKRKDIRVPDHLSIVSLDDFAPSNVLCPAMTSLHLPAFEAGKIAATIVISRLAQQNPGLFNMGVKPDLIIRESTRSLSGN